MRKTCNGQGPNLTLRFRRWRRRGWRRTIHGVDVRYLPSTDSTQDDLRALIAAGAPHLTMVTAGEQRKGRGRSGRSWASPPGNLYTSTLLRPQARWSAPLHATFVAALAVAETVAHWAGAEAVRIKWPNDVLVGGAKIAGILLEAGNARATPGGGHAVDWLALGVGINVGHKPEGMPNPTACLAEVTDTPPEVDAVRERYCAALVAALAAWERDGFPAVRERLLARMAGVGEQVAVRLGDRPADRVEGRFRGLDGDGALLLETAGKVRTITTGDVLLGPAPSPESGRSL